LKTERSEPREEQKNRRKGSRKGLLGLRFPGKRLRERRFPKQ